MRGLRLLLLTIIVYLVYTVASAQTAQKVTLREAEEIALRNHPQLHAASLTVDAARQVPVEIGAARYPNFLASVSGAGASSDARISAGGLNNPLILSRGATGISLSQLLFDFGRNDRLVDTSRLKARAMEQNAEATRAQILLQVDRAYYTALRAQALLRVAVQTVEARQIVAEQVDALRQSGLKSGLDVSIANYNLAEAKLLRSRAQNEVKASFAELNLALGSRDEQLYELEEEPIPPVRTPDEAEYVRKAFHERPELKGLAFERDAAYQFVKAEKALKFPSVTALWNAGWAPWGDSRLPGRYNAAGFTVTIPIFNGRLFKARAAEAEFKARAVDENLRDLENRVARDVRVAWLSANNAYERVELSAQLRTRANEALDLAQERYRLGLSSIVELSQAQLNVTAAEIEGANAKYEYLLQRTLLDYQSGQLR